MNETEKGVLEKFKNLVERSLSVYKIIVFGSRARGDAELDSDLDVLVIAEEDNLAKARQIVSQCAWEADFASGIILSPIVYRRSDWEQGPEKVSLLSEAIRQEGIPI